MILFASTRDTVESEYPVKFEISFNPVAILNKNNNSKLFIIKFITDYEKKDLTKDTSGKVQNYQLNFSTKFIVVSDGKEREFIFNEKFIMKNFEDDFEGRNYENDIKENIENLIYQKLMIQLARIE